MTFSNEPILEVRNLLLAALLLVGGARLVSVEPSGRSCIVKIDISSLLPEHLKNSFEILSNRAASISASSSIEELEHLYGRSILGSLEREYMMLKRLVARAKKKKPPCPPKE